MTETWLLIAALTLRSGEPVDALISIHPTEAACITALAATAAKPRRRLDCRPCAQAHN